MPAIAAHQPVLGPDLEQIVLRQVEQWLAQCHDFREWYRSSFLLQDPSADEEKLADEVQPWMIRITRSLLSQILDPQFPYPHLASTVQGMLWQLEEDWAARHSPMRAEEAEALIAATFPDHAS
jgi:hypothetical protein